MPPYRSRLFSESSLLERLTLLHVGILLIATTWGFGGNALWLRPIIAWWGSLGVLITLSAILGPKESGIDLRPLATTWPFLLFNALALISLATPSFREIHFGSEPVYLPMEVPAWRPSTALPAKARDALWLFDALYISCFNVALVFKRRRIVRVLLMVAMFNGLALAAFGTLQKLSGASGLYFGLIKIKQPYFFSSFIYHNHWSAFSIMMAAVCLALAWRFARHPNPRGFSHSPGPAAILAAFFIATTIPLSGSRSGSALMAAFLLAAFVHWIARLVRQRRRDHVSPVLPIAGAALALILAGGAVWMIAGETITARFYLTQQQVATMRATGTIGSRVALYRDTWHMAKDRPLFGWGMASYEYVFTLYNTQQPSRVDHLPIFYSQAHNDWLQSLAEQGFVGTVLIGLCGLLPLAGLRRKQVTSPIFQYLMAGCAIILFYAWMEFPFGNTAVVLCWWLCYFCAVRYAQLHPADNQTED